LRVNATLTSVNLDENGIGDEGATQLAEGMRFNATLTSLDMGSNDMSNVGKLALRATCPPLCQLKGV